MNKTSPQGPSKALADDSHTITADPLMELRALLLGPIQTELAKLKGRLDDPVIHAKDISGVLAEAIVLRSTQDKKILTRALSPAVEDIVKSSLERDRKTLISALFPIMGSAVRKAITEAFKRMVQSVNIVLERSLSLQGLMWRLEARRTGVPLAEVVLLHSLVYRVEQAFLIHRHTGLVLQHVVAEEAAYKDPDMVSGMLTAIQDFIHDSFGMGTGEALNSIQLGELTVWIEQGPQAMLAVVIRGSPPAGLRAVFQEALEIIHFEQSSAFESFKGDAAPFEASRPHLDSCLQSLYQSPGHKPSPILWVLVASLIVGLGLLTFLSLRGRLRWAEYVDELKAQPGIVVTAAGKRSGRYFVYGLRDPLAADPGDLLNKSRLDAREVTYQWKPYLSLNHELVLERTRRVLNPPESVSLQLDGGVLTTKGSAPHKWIEDTRILVRALPGIVRFQDKELVDADLKELNAVRERLEKRVILFALNGTGLIPNQQEALEDMATELQQAYELAQVVRRGFRVEILGHTDQSGTEGHNMSLSQRRADEIRSFLTAKGIPPTILTAVGVGPHEPAREGTSARNVQLNRSATLRIILTKQGDKDDVNR